METPEFVRLCLAHFRAEGLPFMLAWSRALHSIPRGTNVEVIRQRREWIELLKWSRPAWQAAYEGVALEVVLAREAELREQRAAGRAPELAPSPEFELSA